MSREEDPEYAEVSRLMTLLLAEHLRKVTAFVDGGRADGHLVTAANQCQEIASLFGWENLKNMMAADARRQLDRKKGG